MWSRIVPCRLSSDELDVKFENSRNRTHSLQDFKESLDENTRDFVCSIIVNSTTKSIHSNYTQINYTSDMYWEFSHWIFRIISTQRNIPHIHTTMYVCERLYNKQQNFITHLLFRWWSFCVYGKGFNMCFYNVWVNANPSADMIETC